MAQHALRQRRLSAPPPDDAVVSPLEKKSTAMARIIGSPSSCFLEAATEVGLGVLDASSTNFQTTPNRAAQKDIGTDFVLTVDDLPPSLAGVALPSPEAQRALGGIRLPGMHMHPSSSDSGNTAQIRKWYSEQAAMRSYSNSELPTTEAVVALDLKRPSEARSISTFSSPGSKHAAQSIDKENHARPNVVEDFKTTLDSKQQHLLNIDDNEQTGSFANKLQGAESLGYSAVSFQGGDDDGDEDMRAMLRSSSAGEYMVGHKHNSATGLLR